MDSNREIRAMILLSLHLPPIPVYMHGALDADDSTVENREDPKLQTSHDLIGMLIDFHSSRGNAEQDTMRQRNMEAQLDHFYQQLGEICKKEKSEIKGEDIYGFYKIQTAVWLNMYVTHKNWNIRFANLDQIYKGDPTHKRMVDYTLAHEILLSEVVKDFSVEQRVKAIIEQEDDEDGNDGGEHRAGGEGGGGIEREREEREIREKEKKQATALESEFFKNCCCESDDDDDDSENEAKTKAKSDEKRKFLSDLDFTQLLRRCFQMEYDAYVITHP